MKYKLQARGFEVTNAIKDYLDRRLEKIDRSFQEDRIISADARFEKEKGTYRFEFTVHVPNVVIRVEERGNDLYSLIDSATDVLERRLKAYKERRRKSKRISRKEAVVEPPSDEFEEEAEGEIPIVKRKRFSMKPMLLEEAVEQMKLLGHSFFVFRNADTNEVNVLYLRNDGKLGLIELSE